MIITNGFSCEPYTELCAWRHYLPLRVASITYTVKMSQTKSDEVPVDIIPNTRRIARLNEIFFEEFHCKPSFYVRVPGRVNIIGEHIDYCGYPVLPMALEQDILVAAGLLDVPKLQLRNVNEKYKSFGTDIKCFEAIEITPDPNGKPFWYNYVLCGIKGALEKLDYKIIHGLQLCVDGNIPPASGLSSSSALVSAACLAFLFAQNANLNKTEIASLCARCERYIGTQGGGMDQAIAFLAEKYSAQYITFQPTLNATAVSLPEDATFVVAHSLAEANKAATNDFNRRVIECRLAAKILATCTDAANDKKIITLSDVQNLLNSNLDDMISLVHKFLSKDVYTKAEICDILKISMEDLDELYMTPNTKHLKEFKLKQRALHVYEEAKRVEDFRKVCMGSTLDGKSDSTNGTNGIDGIKNGVIIDDTLNVLGDLISKSHQSLKTLYECSHENLDQLVELSKKMGVHSRLTGAGWGGCIVALCPKENLDNYITKLKEEFYEKLCKINKENASNYVFATTPNHGAVIYK